MVTFSHIPFSLPIASSDFQGKPDLSHLTVEQEIKQEMIGCSAAMRRLRLQVRRIGPHFRTVLVYGERGVGKETVARALHQVNAGRDDPFVVSAEGNRIDSLMKIARRGTLFFHEISEMPLVTQDEFLKILRRHEWAREGLAAPQRIGPRIIAATHRDLRTLAVGGGFRQELYQRLTMVQMGVAPLRERREDIPALAAHFLDRFAREQRKSIVTMTKEALERLQLHEWPGNVRELEGTVREAVSRCSGDTLTERELPEFALPLPTDGDASPESGQKTARLQ
ncbi:MAG TPA: sigma 54-interacting transcriptional regulator, partial [Edaphobacter sp.]|nr:sigma 54-interacting transcriptional regulator [Edaphobacter sp.]